MHTRNFPGHSRTSALSWFDTFARDGHASQPGEIWKSEAHAKTLEKIAKTHAKAFYQGELGDQIDAYSRKTGGYLRKSDLENYWCEWVKPIHVNYRGYDICEIPPNGDGIIALMALNILKGYSFTDRSCVDTVHKQLEAMNWHLRTATGMWLTRSSCVRRWRHLSEDTQQSGGP